MSGNYAFIVHADKFGIYGITSDFMSSVITLRLHFQQYDYRLRKWEHCLLGCTIEKSLINNGFYRIPLLRLELIYLHDEKTCYF